ncbi:hypothetical protein [Archangium lansingense]|uniref:Uncharacterized protein n=1 Tax=Archangium lansingense TaxID=2995310 RepID=A0ABT3ZXJ0_9BACT|nr:hypothetical protein [Archangium lansinium]MCY1074114.1 hypothetical protein [Archangium lansinium]
MDEGKKSESSGEDVEQVGPYQLHEQVAQDELSQGELYRATHETSGAKALVLVPSTGGDAAPLKNWRVRCTSSASPGYVALEVEDSRWAAAPDRYSAEALVCLFEEVHDGVGRMARALSKDKEPHLRWRLGLVLAGAAAACALAFALLRQAPMSPPSDPEPWVSALPAPMRQEVPTDTELSPTGSSLSATAEDGGPPVLARPFPRKPYKGQRLPPCKPRVEVEIMGACWVPHKLTAPCPEDLYEYNGECFTASMASPPLPRSLGQ